MATAGLGYGPDHPGLHSRKRQDTILLSKPSSLAVGPPSLAVGPPSLLPRALSQDSDLHKVDNDRPFDTTHYPEAHGTWHYLLSCAMCYSPKDTLHMNSKILVILDCQLIPKTLYHVKTKAVSFRNVVLCVSYSDDATRHIYQ